MLTQTRVFDQLMVAQDLSVKAHEAVRQAMEYTGEKNANAKLSDEEILEIRRLRASGSSYRHLKARFGIKSNGHVRNIITGKLWGHLPLLAGSAGR